MNGKIDLIVNTPIGKSENVDDSYLRKAAIKKKVPYITTMAAAKATVSGIQSMKKPGCGEVKIYSGITQRDYRQNVKKLLKKVNRKSE